MSLAADAAVDGVGVHADGGCTPLGTHCDNGQRACACENCLDDDGDGRADVGADVECSSYLDDDEGTFATGSAGESRTPACEECFFDDTSSSLCKVADSCVTTGIPSTGCGATNSCAFTTDCADACLGYVPNGCDCFGCCSIRKDGASFDVMIGSACDATQLTATVLPDGGVQTDYGACTQCVPNASCQNACGRCELCLGKTLADVPADCFPSTVDAGGATTGPSCEGGLVACGSGLPPCAAGHICVFGCCLVDSRL